VCCSGLVQKKQKLAKRRHDGIIDKSSIKPKRLIMTVSHKLKYFKIAKNYLVKEFAKIYLVISKTPNIFTKIGF